ncbi:MAG TPA: LCP family protein [Dermatophilaceae bacterium]|nr:LCP family protein [Dermatophilaceae bacterium]
MVHVFLPSSRPAVFAGLSALLVGALALSGCTSTPKKVVVAPTTTAVSPTTEAVVTPPPFTATGIPAALAAVIEPLYYGGAVAASPAAAKVLLKRKPVKAPGTVVVKGAVASWKGVPIAVVTRGRDVTLAVAAPRWKVVGGWWPSVGVAAPSLGGTARRVLLVGSDARPGQAIDGARADSLHIVGLDGHSGGGILGIARDAYVPLSTGGRGKINSALSYGGPKALQRTVVSATGVPVEGYMITGFAGFKELINGVGGLRLKAPVAVKDAGSSADVKVGVNQLSGVQALSYARARHGVAGGDFGRSANQGLLIKALADFARLAGPTRLPGLLHMADPKIATNLSAEQVLTFAAGAYVVPSNRIHNRVAAGSFGWTSDRQSIVLFDASARRMFADIKDGNLS